MITSSDDGWVRTHDEMRALLEYTVPGARVEVLRVRNEGSQRASESTRQFVLRFSRLSGEVVSEADLYALPCQAAPIQRRAVDLARRAVLC